MEQDYMDFWLYFYTDIPDGGAEHFAKTVSYIKERYRDGG